jgi:hypothetical protein
MGDCRHCGVDDYFGCWLCHARHDVGRQGSQATTIDCRRCEEIKQISLLYQNYYCFYFFSVVPALLRPLHRQSIGRRRPSRTAQQFDRAKTVHRRHRAPLEALCTLCSALSRCTARPAWRASAAVRERATVRRRATRPVAHRSPNENLLQYTSSQSTTPDSTTRALRWSPRVSRRRSIASAVQTPAHAGRQ